MLDVHYHLPVKGEEQSPDSLLVITMQPTFENQVGYMTKELGLNGRLESLTIYIGTKTWVTIPKQLIEQWWLREQTLIANVDEALRKPFQEVYYNLMQEVHNVLFGK